MKPLAATSGAGLHGMYEFWQRQMHPVAVTGARRAAAPTPEAERLSHMPPASRRAIWSADVQQSAAAVGAAFWDEMVPADHAPLPQRANISRLVRLRHSHSLALKTSAQRR